ncbi:MAG: T9SS type B sorting domain-containing protein [Sphingobacteriaceae bacterium]
MKKLLALVFSVSAFFAFATSVKSGDVFGTRVFIENKGQFDNTIKSTEKVEFGIANGDEKIFFTKKGLTYVLVKTHPMKEWQREALEHGRDAKLKDNDIYYVQMNWQNANANVVIEESEKQSHYFPFGSADKNASCYKKITYKNIYNNIDIEYIIPEDREFGIKYNIILHPGANPNDIKFEYTGDVRDVQLTKDGNIKIKTPLEPIIEHAPVSYDLSKNKVASEFKLSENTISFNLPQGYDANKTLIIDPWVTNVTTLAPSNYGYDVDYDNLGNLFVYGGNNPNMIAKYSPTGTLIWTFLGTVAVPAWTNMTYASNFVVHKSTGKTYTGQGFASGTRVIRLDVNGNYDNFISTNVTTWMECWDMAYHCSTGNIYGLGGSTSSKQSAGIINQTSGAVTPVAFMQHGTFAHDIVSHAIDNNGEVYWIYASLGGAPALNNQIAKINSAFTTSVWLVPSTYNVMSEAANKNAYIGGTSPSNGFNCLDVNANFLYYYDGLNLAAYNKTTGTKVGFTTIAGNIVKQQGGIAVDDCDNVYIGGKNGDVLCYHFNGTSFSALPSVNLGVTTVNKFIYDIKLDKVNNILYVSGSGFVAQNSAANSLACNTNSYQVVPVCVGNNNGSAVTTVTTNMTNPVFSFTYISTTATVATFPNQTVPSTTVNNLANGNYTVNIQINAPCGPVKTLTFNINCLCSATAAVSTSCTPTGPSFSLSVSAISGFTATPTYSWSGPNNYTANIQSPTFLNGSYGVYTLTAQQPGCVSTATVNATAVSMFTPNITNTAVACFGYSNGQAEVSTITGTSTAPYTYSWTTAPVQTTSLATTLTAGNYTCYVKDAMGCTYMGTTTITQPPALVVSISSNTLQNCSGGSFSLTGNGATSYTWSPNVALSSSVGVNIVATPSVTQTYSVLGSQNTCTGVATITLTIIPNPTLSVVLTSPTICMNNYNGSINTVTLNVSGASTYTWSGITGISTNTTNGSMVVGTSINNSSIASGTVLGTWNTCTNVATFSLAAIPNPVISVTSPSMCLGTATVISASGADTYAWSPNTNLSAITGATVTANPNSNTVYSVIGSSLGCNSATQNGTVFVLPLPTMIVSPINPTICAGSSAGLTAAGAQTYVWSPASSLSSPVGNVVIASPATTTNYTVVGTLNSCTAAVVNQVSVVTLPTLQALADRTVICVGQIANINANGASTYSWTPNLGISNPFTNFIQASPPASTTYSLIGQNGACTGTLTVDIVVLPNPLLQLTTSNNRICYGNNTSIFASGAQNYNWSPNQGINFVNPNVANVSPSVTTNYTVTGMNTTGSISCIMTKEIEIEVVPQVTASISGSVEICEGTSVKLNAGGSNTYIWAPSTGLNTTLSPQPYAQPNETTIYTVQVSNGGYCGATATVLVKVNPNPTVYAGPDMTYNTDEPMYINAKGTGTLTWIEGEEIYCKPCPNSQIFPKTSGCYKVLAVNEFGCKAIDDVCIEVTMNHNIYIPNIFTPNEDGVNDVFLVYGTGILKIEMIVFDRWGEKLFTSTDQLKGWDGVYKGKLSKNDMYVYLVNYTALDGKKYTKTGHVTLLK